MDSNINVFFSFFLYEGYDDEPDVDVGDTDVGADFGDFGF